MTSYHQAHVLRASSRSASRLKNQQDDCARSHRGWQITVFATELAGDRHARTRGAKWRARPSKSASPVPTYYEDCARPYEPPEVNAEFTADAIIINPSRERGLQWPRRKGL